MAKTGGGLARYGAAAAELRAARGHARGLAEVLEYLAGLLRGHRADPVGPPPAACPTPSGVLSALRRIDEARSLAEREWERLPDGDREAVPPPEELDDGAGW